jgi:hypothetical protein
MFELVVYIKATSADKGHTTPRPWNKAAYFVVVFLCLYMNFALLILLDVWYNLHLLAAFNVNTSSTLHVFIAIFF